MVVISQSNSTGFFNSIMLGFSLTDGMLSWVCQDHGTVAFELRCSSIQSHFLYASIQLLPGCVNSPYLRQKKNLRALNKVSPSSTILAFLVVLICRITGHQFCGWPAESVRIYIVCIQRLKPPYTSIHLTIYLT